MKRTSSKKVFKTRETKIWNWVLMSVLIFVIIGLTDFFPPELVVLGALAWIGLLLFVWFVWARNFFRIEIFNGKVSGPSEHLQKIVIPAADIDLNKLAGMTDFKKRLGRYAIVSKSGKIIYMYSRLLSPKQMEKITLKIQEEIAKGQSLFK